MISCTGDRLLRSHEVEGRGVRAAVRAAHPSAGDAGGRRVDIYGRVGWTYRMAHTRLRHSGHELLVAGAVVHPLDIPRPIRRVDRRHRQVNGEINTIAKVVKGARVKR